jgi:hypothetical protein
VRDNVGVIRWPATCVSTRNTARIVLVRRRNWRVFSHSGSSWTHCSSVQHGNRVAKISGESLIPERGLNPPRQVACGQYRYVVSCLVPFFFCLGGGGGCSVN